MKNPIKVLALTILSLSAVAGISSCGETSETVFSAGLITLHGDTSTYDANFIEAFKAACKAKNVKPIITTDVGESADCTVAADNLVDQGCKYIFADSFGHESFLMESARKAPEVKFSHATGTQAHTANLDNFSNAFASIYEGRYLAGVTAGLKLKDMLEKDPNTSKVIGYVGAHPYAEVVSGYTSYYLGVRSIVSDVTMKVLYTGSWYDETKEKTAANTLINNYKASVISQHADSWGAPTACEKAGVPNVSYNGSTEKNCKNTYLVSSKIDWQPYFEHCFDKVLANENIEKDYTGTLGSTLYNGSVALSPLGQKAPVSGTEAKLNEVADALRDGSLKVFDCSKFTVNGEHLTSYIADVNSDPAYTPDTEVIKTEGGVTYFAESEFRSAPYFDVRIDGIEELGNVQ